jgi:hypothetical protein
MNDMCIPSWSQWYHELFGWLARLLMHHRGELKFSMIFVLYS